VLLEVLPLDHAARPPRRDGFDELLDELVVCSSAQPRPSVADVERVGEELGVVGPDVEGDR
jgi:hypothetical protein